MEGLKLTISKDNDISLSLSQCTLEDAKEFMHFINTIKGCYTYIGGAKIGTGTINADAIVAGSITSRQINEKIEPGHIMDTDCKIDKLTPQNKWEFQVGNLTNPTLNKSELVIKSDQSLDSLDRVRNRLPNEYDLNELKISQAESSDIFMCPACGQHTLAASREGILCKANKLFIYPGIEVVKDSIEEYDKDFEFILVGLEEFDGEQCEIAYDESNSLTCPRCKMTAPNTDWIDTARHPERTFEYGDICECCGSEIETVQDIKTGEITHKCINENCVRSEGE